MASPMFVLIDSYSKYIPGFHMMSVKNNLIIYENLYRYICSFDCYMYTLHAIALHAIYFISKLRLEE